MESSSLCFIILLFAFSPIAQRTKNAMLECLISIMSGQASATGAGMLSGITIVEF